MVLKALRVPSSAGGLEVAQTLIKYGIFFHESADFKSAKNGLN